MDADAPEPVKPFPQMQVIAAVFAVLLVLMVGWYFLVLRQDYAVLYADLRPQEAASVVEALEKQGVPYRLGAGGAEIRVPAAKLDAARLELASSDTPIGGLDGFELFNESDMGLTDFAQKIRYQRALQGELARTIMMMDGVADARVHISMPERTLFRGERRNAEAAITLVTRTPQDETPARIEGVQRLVAAAVPDLLVSDVVVLNGRGEIISPRVEVADGLARGRQGVEDPNAPSIEFVMDIMRGALANRRFEVTIEPAPASLEGASAGEAIISQRIVTVMTETPLSDGEMEGVGAALRGAGIVDGASGGTLVFRLGPSSMFASLPAATTSAATSSTAEAASTAPSLDTILPWIGLAGLALMLLAAVGLWVWLNRPKLVREEHERFADQLRTGLQAHESPNA
jgi:flagellar M-ring protein FliF